MDRWMRDLPPEVRAEVPLSRLAMPGSHNSFTYRLDLKSPVGPDADAKVAWLGNHIGSVFKPVIYRWARCQRLDVRSQLEAGVRYFDIRIGDGRPYPGDPRGTRCGTRRRRSSLKKRGGAELQGGSRNPAAAAAAAAEGDTGNRVLHTLYGDPVMSTLAELNDFLVRNPGEVVVLHFQHTYYRSGETAEERLLADQVADLFRGRMWGPPSKGRRHHRGAGPPTLAEMEAAGCQAVVVYPKAAEWVPEFWDAATWGENPWPNTTSTSALAAALEEGLVKRDMGRFFVSQGILTPDLAAILRGSSLEATLAAKCNKFLARWLADLKGQQPRDDQLRKRVNIVIADFFDDGDKYNLGKMVVDLNLD